jgi:hypothetical protein
MALLESEQCLLSHLQVIILSEKYLRVSSVERFLPDVLLLVYRTDVRGLALRDRGSSPIACSIQVNENLGDIRYTCYLWKVSMTTAAP